MKEQAFCVECGLRFGLVERSEFCSTCVECLGRMRSPVATCSCCHRVIESAQSDDVWWTRAGVLCSQCNDRRNHDSSSI